ncbi:Satratoxin biosynthesis SC1 cluster protein 4 [Colletotrichum sp. SAR11_239]|nr:Satratoxin biosynthesis SC1 cluster protein 4 [Colletotrichum sp. SAR11_239]
MKASYWGLPILACLPVVYGLYDNVPDCALPCVFEPLDYTPCEFTNSTCLCEDMNYNMAVIHCVRIQCSLMMVAFLVATTLAKRAGIGRDIWTLNVDQITSFIRGFFAFEIVYSITLASIKASILFLYLRIFGAITETFRQILWGTQIFNVAVCITFVIVNLNQCKPLSYFWYGWDGRHPGYCIDLTAMALSHAALNIALDVWMLVLPATQIYRLNLQKRQKAGIMSMFGVGIFITIVSAIRLKSVATFSHSWNPTYDFYGLAMWSHTEVCVGLIVACMPAARSLARRLFPELLYVTKVSTTRQSTRASGNVKIVSQDIATIATDDNLPGSSTMSSPSNSSKKDSLATLTPDRVPLKRLTTSDSLMDISPSERPTSFYSDSQKGSKLSDWE